MATLKTRIIQPSTGTNVNLGNAGTAILVNSDSIQTNVYKDSGGNTLFQSDGAGTLSNVNSALTGAGPKLILSQTASDSTSISFTSGIDSTYDHYMFVFVNMRPASNSQKFNWQVSSDGGSSYGMTTTSTFFRAYNYEGAPLTSGIAYDASAAITQSTAYIPTLEQIGNGADQSASGILHLYSPSSTTYMKNFASHVNAMHAIGIELDCWSSGYVNSTTAINAIDFKMASGNIVDGTIKMYGVA